MLSVFDMFKIGIGPSSSHTVGPMVAARAFAEAALKDTPLPPPAARLHIDLYGSLALTGEGHGTLGALLAGLEGNAPDTVNPALIAPRLANLRDGAELMLGGRFPIPFLLSRDLILHRGEFLPRHSNGMRFQLMSAEGQPLWDETYYSVGGGFVVRDVDFDHPPSDTKSPPPYPFQNGAELLELCRRENKSIAEIALLNEMAWRDEADIRQRLARIARVMQDCIENGCRHEGVLPGGYNVSRRAPGIFRKMVSMQLQGRQDIMLWPMLYAIAVSEENAAGGRVVTAPTNGAAGIIPSVLQYYHNFNPAATERTVADFLLTAGVIGMLYKMNASISGAEVGCQGEVGVACSMAAGAYCAVIGGTLEQVENAAEIAMEHHLGLTCDPVGGLVQIPCIERNGLAAEQAIKCAQLACLEDGAHKISLDQVIATMYRTGLDMQNKYKETAQGGLALTVGNPSC